MVEIETIITLIGMSCGIVATYYKGVIQKNEELAKAREELQKQLDESSKKVLEMQTRFDIFWKVIEAELPKILVRPTHKDMDELLFKLSEGKMSAEEARKLIEMIDEEIHSGEVLAENKGQAIGLAIVKARLISKFRESLSMPGVG